MEGRKEKRQNYTHILSMGNEESDGAINRKYMSVRRGVSTGVDDWRGS